MLLQLTGFIFDCRPTCIILPTPIVRIDNYCYLYYSTLFSPFTALYFILHLSYTLKKGHFENKPFIHSFIHSFIHLFIHSFIHCHSDLQYLWRSLVYSRTCKSNYCEIQEQCDCKWMTK